MTSAWYGIVILLWVLGNPRYWSTRGEGRRERATRYGLDGLGGGHNQPAPAPHGEHNRSRRRRRNPGLHHQARGLRRITGRSGLRRATTPKPCRAKAAATPGNRLVVWPGTAVSIGLQGRSA